MLYSIRDKDGNVVFQTTKEKEAKSFVKHNKELIIKKVGPVWPT